MITNEHKKHNDLARPAYGNYNRNEWAIVGTECGVIKRLAAEVIKAVSPYYKCAYIDAQHAGEEESGLLPRQLVEDALLTFTGYNNYHQVNFKKEPNDFQFRQLFNDADLVLVNGNHYKAAAQVVVIDNAKRESLRKRLQQLTNIELILLTDNVTEVFDFIKDFPAYNTTPVYNITETGKIIDFFKTKMQEAKPVLNGLVLAGGKSKRMGVDKGTIKWHEQEQRYHGAALLQKVCKQVFISCRPEQQNSIDNNYPSLEDTFTDLGPFGAILSAFRKMPDAAWLVVACDLPLLDLQTVQQLKDNRVVAAMATAFESPFNHFPEPLITIWEPKSYPVLLSFLSQGYNCPGKALRNMDTAVLQVMDPATLTNVNTPADMELVKQMISKKKQVYHE